MANEWLTWLPVVSLLLSIVSCAVLLLWLCKVKKIIAGQLMARQLWHLAVADLLSSIGHMCWFGLPPLWVYFGVGSDDARYPKLDAICQFGMYSNIPFMTSVLIEVHIALATASVVGRHQGFMRALSCTLPLVWPLGIPLGLVVVGGNLGSWDAASGRCNTGSLVGQRFKSIVVLVALVLCIASYVAGAFSTGWAAGSVQRRAWRRSHWFVAAAVVTWLPFMIFDFIFQPQDGVLVTDSDEVAYYVSYGLLLSNGLINAFVYALQSRIVRQTQRRARLSTGSSGGGNERVAEFGVAFRSVHSVVEIDPLTAEANHRAQSMTEALEVRSGTANDFGEDGDLLACFESEDQSNRPFQFADAISLFSRVQPAQPAY